MAYTIRIPYYPNRIKVSKRQYDIFIRLLTACYPENENYISYDHSIEILSGYDYRSLFIMKDKGLKVDDVFKNEGQFHFKLSDTVKPYNFDQLSGLRDAQTGIHSHWKNKTRNLDMVENLIIKEKQGYGE